MLPESIATLERHLPIWHLYNKSQEVVNFYPHIQSELVKVIHDEFDPYYHHNASCGECIKQLLITVYKWYDKQKLAGNIPRK